jgi:glycopeptide antibiotics resistance protein
MFLKNNYPALLWAVFIAVLCGMPGKDIPHISFLELLEFDKLVHASVFFVLVLLMIKGFKKISSPLFLQNHPFTLAILLSVAYGGLLEILQCLVFIDRSADILDFIANSFGCLMALVYFKVRNKNKA